MAGGSTADNRTDDNSTLAVRVQVEDDMAIPEDTKVPLLRVFHEKSYDR